MLRGWASRNRGKRAESTQRDRERQPERHRARYALRNAVAQGTIEKPDRCEGCNKELPPRRIHGHHTDYSKPLEVEWLCAGCHKKRHIENPAED